MKKLIKPLRKKNKISTAGMDPQGVILFNKKGQKIGKLVPCHFIGEPDNTELRRYLTFVVLNGMKNVDIVDGRAVCTTPDPDGPLPGDIVKCYKSGRQLVVTGFTDTGHVRLMDCQNPLMMVPHTSSIELFWTYYEMVARSTEQDGVHVPEIDVWPVTETSVMMNSRFTETAVMMISRSAQRFAEGAGIGSMEIAGQLISCLAKDPARIKSYLNGEFMGSPEFRVEQGVLSWMGKDGTVHIPGDIPGSEIHIPRLGDHVTPVPAVRDAVISPDRYIVTYVNRHGEGAVQLERVPKSPLPNPHLMSFDMCRRNYRLLEMTNMPEITCATTDMPEESKSGVNQKVSGGVPLSRQRMKRRHPVSPGDVLRPKQRDITFVVSHVRNQKARLVQLDCPAITGPYWLDFHDILEYFDISVSNDSELEGWKWPKINPKSVAVDWWDKHDLEVGDTVLSRDIREEHRVIAIDSSLEIKLYQIDRLDTDESMIWVDEDCMKRHFFLLPKRNSEVKPETTLDD